MSRRRARRGRRGGGGAAAASGARGGWRGGGCDAAPRGAPGGGGPRARGWPRRRVARPPRLRRRGVRAARRRHARASRPRRARPCCAGSGSKSVEIRREPLRPGVGRELDLGTPIALPRGARVPGRARRPRRGLPDAAARRHARHLARLRRPAEGSRSDLPRERRRRSSRSRSGPPTRSSGSTVDGARAYWITGAHGFAYQSPDGFGYEDQRLSDRVLLVERDGLLMRVEGAISRDRAVEIARSVF